MFPLRFILPFYSVAKSHRRRAPGDAEKGDLPDGADPSSENPPPAFPRSDTVLTDISVTPGSLDNVDEDDEVVEEEYTPKYRWTPLLSGLIIPFSILLEIPGLTEHWYIRTSHNQIIEFRSNPAILDVGIAVSMGAAVLANACLIMRFLERKIRLSTELCIAFLTLHDIINIVAVTYFGVIHRFNDGFTYGEAFWITVCSTIVSVFVNVSLIVDLVRTENFDTSGSGLTRKQRLLVIVIVAFLCYVAIGSLINCFILGRTFIEGLYFSLVTIETIGFGDIVPVTPAARVWTCCYAAGGIVNLGVAVGILSDNIMEALEAQARARLEGVRRRRREMKRLHKAQARWRSVVELRLRGAHLPVWVPDDEHIAVKVRGGWLGIGLGGAHKVLRPSSGRVHLNLEALSPAELELSAQDAGVPLAVVYDHYAHHQRRFGGAAKVQVPELDADVERLARDGGPLDTPGSPRPQTRFADVEDGGARGRAREGSANGGRSNLKQARSRSREDFSLSESAQDWLAMTYEDFQEGVESEEQRQFFAKLSISVTLFLIFWLLGSGIFMVTEGWTYGTAMYFCFISFSTIGYGDYHIVTPAGRAVFVVWAILGVATMTFLISMVCDAFSSRYKSALRIGVFDKAVKRYRTRRIAAELASRPRSPAPYTPSLHSVLSNYSLAQRGNEKNTGESVERTASQAQALLEALPGEILGHAKTFHEHVQYVMGHGDEREGRQDPIPEGLKKLLDEIADAEKIEERVKREILQDEESRNTLVMLSVESELAATMLRVLPGLRWTFAEALRKMIGAAERSLDALSERDRAAITQMQPGPSRRDDTPQRELHAIAEVDHVQIPETESPVEMYWKNGIGIGPRTDTLDSDYD